MDAILKLINPQTLDMILSDQMLMVGAILVVVGVFLFLLSAFKYFRYDKTHPEFAVPAPPVDEEYQPEPSPANTNGEEVTERSEPEREALAEPHRTRFNRAEESADQTIVMPPGVSDLQAQFEIAITQIKQLNKKVFEIERQIDTLATRSEASTDLNELKEPPSDPEDYTKKLLKVVEHVIVLEKEVAKLRSGNESPKPPIMPI